MSTSLLRQPRMPLNWDSDEVYPALDEFRIVVAHYHEPLEVFEAFARSCIVYDKAEDPARAARLSGAQIIKLPNLGREGQTYLRHIVTNWDTLSDITLFTQADPFDHVGAHVDVTEMVRLALNTPDDKVASFSYKGLRTSREWNGLDWIQDSTWLDIHGETLQRAGFNLEKFWKLTTGETTRPNAVQFSEGCCFAIPKKILERRGLEFWKKALKMFEDHSGVNPEVGLYMERCWLAFLSDEFQIR